jgi:predicted RecB family nuclease
MKKASKDELLTIPGVGKSIAGDLHELGIHQIKDLVGRNPRELYDQHCAIKGQVVDRCVLYTFRGAVYFAETPDPEPELMKWWNWKDRSYRED